MQENRREQDIAVVGLAGRFPGASSLEQFFENCCQGKETITHFPREAMEKAGIHPNLYTHPDYVPAKGVLEGIDLFDADFFGFSELDANILDPQHRLFLMCAWEALQDAGFTPKQSPARVGVFASTGMSMYLHHNLLKNPDLLTRADEFQLLLGNDKDFLATRVSYLLNLTGPSINIQTGCSSSLVCIHYAIQSILNGECDMALAGGVSITVPQEQGYVYRKDMIGSPDGHCYAFDARAQGTVKSNGVGVVALKPLADAIAAQDEIYAVVRGSAVNNDGSRKVGFTAPNAQQQAEVIKEALMMADVESASIGYIETHGTGTLLGDPIEIAGLKQAFGQSHNHDHHCALVALKSTMGHLDVAAGVASFIRACLAIYHGKIPPSLHFSELNPKISLENTPFYINTRLQDWPSSSWPKRAGVSAFGVGGTNVHVILQSHDQSSPLKKFSVNHPWNLRRYWIDPVEVDHVPVKATDNPVEHLDCELILKQAWNNVLGSPPIADDAHFFNQGGHSLAAIQLIEQLPKSLRKNIEVVHLYQYPQFYQLVQFIKSQQQKGLNTLEKAANQPQESAEVVLFCEGVEL